MVTLRLTCSGFWVDVRLREINGRWIASAETPDGPSLGLGLDAVEAVELPSAVRGDRGRATGQGRRRPRRSSDDEHRADQA
jgi:hypothetical protein